MTDETYWPERREFGRRTTFLHGFVRCKGRPVIACIVRNLSVKGGQIELTIPCQMPIRFSLEIECAGFEGLCETRYQRGLLVGVMFVDEETTVVAKSLLEAEEKKAREEMQELLGFYRGKMREIPRSRRWLL